MVKIYMKLPLKRVFEQRLKSDRLLQSFVGNVLGID